MKVTVRKAAVVAALAALTLSSCGQNKPGVAADVDGAEITDAKVDDFATVLCALGGLPSETASGTPTKDARFRSLQILLGNQLAEDVADLDNVDRAAVNAAVEQLNSTRDSVPESVVDTFDQVVEEYATTQNAIIALGRASLEKSGTTGDIADDAAYAEGDRLRTEYAAKADISIDPRFGTMVDGVLTAGEGSLSVPVSPLAKEAAAATPSAELVAGLPASQKCGE